jgi:hypothetical protein
MEGNLDSKRQGEVAPRISTNQGKANITTTKRGISSNRSGSPYMFFVRWDSPVQYWPWKETDSHCDPIGGGGVSVPVFTNFTRPTPYLLKSPPMSQAPLAK